MSVPCLLQPSAVGLLLCSNTAKLAFNQVLSQSGVLSMQTHTYAMGTSLTILLTTHHKRYKLCAFRHLPSQLEICLYIKACQFKMCVTYQFNQSIRMFALKKVLADPLLLNPVL